MTIAESGCSSPDVVGAVKRRRTSGESEASQAPLTVSRLPPPSSASSVRKSEYKTTSSLPTLIRPLENTFPSPHRRLLAKEHLIAVDEVRERLGDANRRCGDELQAAIVAKLLP